MIGRTLGGYRIMEQIGLGGMATVYKAYDPGTERNVALKILPEYHSKDPAFRERFEFEARAIANLEHLHILPVFAYGEEDGITYLVMRYMQTGTLADRISAGRLPLDETSRLLTQIAGALDHAHQNGIIHRDVKPSNVLLDKGGNAYLTDFGIARMIEGTGELTHSNIIGTPQYMSPEQCEGRKDLTPASDQYSLGIILYEMLTGRKPFQAETPVAIMMMHLRAPLPPPRTLRPDLPESIERVLYKALAKEPSARFATCAAMAAAVARAIDSGSPSADPISYDTVPVVTSPFPPSHVFAPPVTPAEGGLRSLWRIGSAFIVALMFSTMFGACSMVGAGIPVVLQPMAGAIFVYLSRKSGGLPRTLNSALGAGLVGLAGALIGSLAVLQVFVMRGMLEFDPEAASGLYLLAVGCAPFSAGFAALGGFGMAALLRSRAAPETSQISERGDDLPT